MAFKHTDISRMLETAVVAARLAGQRAMEEIRYTRALVKNDDELVTEADSICQGVIIDRIKATYPDHGFIAEEGQGIYFRQPPRGPEPVWWAIDPIDGTNNYAKGILNFTVSIAAMYEGSPIVAAVFEPATNSMFTATSDDEAQLNYSAITAGEEQTAGLSLFAINSDFTDRYAAFITEMMRRTKVRNFGSTALQLAYMAKGSFIGTFTSKARLWDFAAGALLVERAGGIVTDTQGRKVFPIDMENYTGQEYQLISANRKSHPVILKSLLESAGR